jgi:hypothetical protein
MNEQLVASLTSLAVEILKPIAALIATVCLGLIVKKLNLAVSAEQQAKFEKDIVDAVARWEEKEASGQANGTSKLVGVVGDVKAAHPKKTEEQIVDAVHAILPRVGLGATARKAAEVAAAAAGGFLSGKHD